jgi:membrane-associated phospholipid phosphatase
MPQQSIRMMPRETVPMDRATRTDDAPTHATASAPLQRRDFAVLGLLLVAGALALFVDVALSRAMIKDDVLHALHQTLEALEPFGHPVAILLILASIFSCHFEVRRRLPRVALTMFAGGMLANLFKVMVARVRPYHYDFSGGVFDTFQGILPGIAGGSRVQSCPSAHVATAVAAALALGTVYPRGVRMFSLIAGFVAVHRIQTGAHFLSDTLWGTAVGYLAWMLMYRTSFSGRWFDRHERSPPGGAVASPEHYESISADDRVHKTRRTGSGRMDIPPGGGPAAHPAGCGNAESPATYSVGRFRRLSVVIPVYDEHESIPLLYAELDATLGTLPLEREIIFVDDGSTDPSARLIREITERDSTVGLVTFDRNLGQAAALAAGIEHATGDVIATLDADLQNDPRDIPHMISMLACGCDVVHGWRKNRRDRWIDRRLPSIVANRLISLVGGYRLHDTGCTLKVMRADLARRLPLFAGMHRFIPVLANALGGTCLETVVNHRAREFGRSKYGLSRTLRILADLPRLWYVTNFLKAHTQTLHAIGDAQSATGARASLNVGSSRERAA